MRLAQMQIDSSAWGWLKAALYVIAGYVALALDYIDADTKIVYTLSGLMIADWITGIIKAHRLKISITSKRSNKGVIEKLALLIIPISIAVAIKAFADFPIALTVKSAFGILIWGELYSLLGNLYCIYTKTDIKEYDVITAIIRWIRQSIFKGLKNFMTDNNKGHEQEENRQEDLG